MTVLMMFGDESTTAVAMTPDGVEVVEGLDAMTVTDLGRTATALGRLAEARPVLAGHEVDAGVVDAASTVGESLLGEIRDAFATVEEDDSVLYVDGDSAVLIGPDGTATSLPLRAHRDAAATLDTLGVPGGRMSSA
jgi:hypothetical protein